MDTIVVICYMLLKGYLYTFFALVFSFKLIDIYGQTGKVISKEHYYPITKLETLKKNITSAGIKDALKLSDTDFAITKNKGFNLKPGSSGNWLRINLHNTDTSSHPIIIEITNPFLYRVCFYTVNKDGQVLDSMITGTQYPWHVRRNAHPNFQYAIDLNASAEIDCYIDIDVGNATGDFNLFIWNKEKRAEYQLLETKYLSYFFVINVTFLVLLGLAIFLTRQKYHWYFFIYAFFGFLYIYTELGLGFKNLWPEYPAFQNAAILLIANIYQIFGISFVRKYFATHRRQQMLDRALIILIFSALVFEIAGLLSLSTSRQLPQWFVYTNTILFLISGFFVFAVAITALKFKSLKNDAIWFIIGFTPHALSILQLCIRPFGLFNNQKEHWFKSLAPVYIETINPPNFLFWAIIWEVIIVFWLIIKRLKNIYEDNVKMTQQLATQREKNMLTLLTGVEQERKRIAQELHDGSGVALSALKMKLQVLTEKPETGTTGKSKLTELMNDVDKIYDDIRGASHNLMPKTLSKLGLFPAIDELVNQFRLAAPQIYFSYFRKTNTNNFSEAAKINIFRIIQELLTNVVKHSAASEVSLQLIRHNNNLMISVEDDGAGFDSRETRNGIGLTSVESRVQMLNGSLSIDSTLQNGTFISVSIPISSLN